MGFEVGGNTARLEFGEGTPLTGATVRVSLDMSVRDFLALQRTIAGISVENPDELSGDALSSWERAYTQFALSALDSWDLTRNGDPIPATPDGLLSLPFNAANAIFSAWAKAVSSASPNSSTASTNGSTSQAVPAGTER